MTKQSGLPTFLQPMLAHPSEPFDDDRFLFEIKWDGIRMLIFLDQDRYRLVNRHGRESTQRYPEFTFLADLLPGTVLDGEMVVLGPRGPNFGLVQSRDKTRSPLKIRTLSQAQPATYLAFDLLYENYQPLLHLPLLERRQRLERLLHRQRRPALVLSQALRGKGQALFAEICRLGLEGIVAKQASSCYQPGHRSRAWLKIKPHLPGHSRILK